MRRFVFGIFRAMVRMLSGHRLRRFALVDRAYTRLFDRLRPPTAWAHGHRLHVDSNDQVVAQGLLLRATWEPFETALFVDALRPGMIVFCLGAHIGYYALLAARGVGAAGRVYAFEPGPANYRLLVENVKANGYRNVITVPKAVGDRTGRARLYLHPSNGGDHRIFPDADPRAVRDIDMVRLDDWLRDQDLVADVIQMDLQGAEMLALEGMDRLVRRSRDVRIFTELWPEGLRLSGRSAEAYLERLRALGFAMSVIEEAEKRLVPLATPADLSRYGDVLRHPTHGVNLLCRRE